MKQPGRHRYQALRLSSCLGLLCWLVWPLWSLNPSKPLREYGQQAWRTDSGLPQNTVHAITQTRDGFLWVGTEAGLVRFDGADFAVYSTADTAALHSDVISSLEQDGAGSLWIGTADGLVRERAGLFTRYGPSDGLPAAAVFATHITQAGRLIVLTSAGVAAFDRGQFVPITGTDRLGLTEDASLVAEDTQGRVWLGGAQGLASVDRGENNAVPQPITGIGELKALAVLKTGEVWVGGAAGLARIRNSHQPELLSKAKLPGAITSLLAADGGGLWVGTTKGLGFFSQNALQPVAQFNGTRVERLLLDREGTLWVPTDTGLARVVAGTVDRTISKYGLAGVLATFEDREGSMWFGTESSGLHLLRDQTFSTLTTDDGVSSPLVRAVFEDHAGTMWLGTSGGGLDRISDQIGTRFAASHVTPFTGKLPSNVVLALAETKSIGGYDLWVGTPGGLVRLRDGQSKVFTTADGLADDFVRSLYADLDQSLWVSTRNGLSHYQDGSFHSYSKLDGLASDLIGAVVRGSGGTLWVGTLGGLNRFDGSGFQDVSPKLNGAITALLEGPEGSLWVGMNGRGLSRMHAGQVTTYAAPGLPETIYGMLEDAQGDLWLSSRRGIDRVSIAALEKGSQQPASLAVTHYGSADGMRISEASGGGHPAAWRAHDGSLWFATLDGVAVARPETEPRFFLAPQSAIEQVLVDDQAVSPTEMAIRVGHGHGRLSIKYAGLSFIAPQRVQYRYQLQGFDRGWVDAGTRRTAYYTNVPPGAYTFLVRCSNSNGVWTSSAAEQRFIVEPFFYQTGWFYGAVVLTLAGISYLLYHWRAVTVEAQYRAVFEERSRIAREIHDTLAQGYVAVSVQLELAEHLLRSSKEAAAQQIKQTKEIVQEGLAEARSSIWNLRSQADAQALPSRLAAYSNATAQRYTGAIKLTVHGAYRPLTRRIEEEVYRVAQQSIANAVAHAHASSVAVILDYDAQWLELRVADDGVGMRMDEQGHALQGRFGLQGMRERAARIGAKLEVESAPGCGVTITLRVNSHGALRKGER